jgi:hypothetical protein
MHPDLLSKFGFVMEAAGDAVVVCLGEDLCIPVFGNLLEQGKGIRAPFFKLFDKGAG